jgi:hypothetical protein
VIVILDNISPVGPTHRISATQRMGLPHKVRPGVKAHVVISNDNLLIKPYHKFLLPIDLKSNVHSALVEENDFIYFI